MTAPWIADLSFGHDDDSVKGAALKARGCVGVIGYTGCDDNRKNATKANIDDWLANGLLVGLVIENGAQDVLGGAPAGHYLGTNVMAGAKSVGYDVAHCVLYVAADWNTTAGQQPAVDAALAAFASHVPHPGLYGNSYAIDYVIARGHAEYGWQSNSTSFSYGPSPKAHLLQRYNDPRAAGLPVDANDIQHTPLGLMGEGTDMPLDDTDKLWLRQLMNELLGEPTHPTTPSLRNFVRDTAAGLKIPTADAVAAAVIAKLPPAAAGGLTTGDVKTAVKAALAEGVSTP